MTLEKFTYISSKSKGLTHLYVTLGFKTSANQEKNQTNAIVSCPGFFSHPAYLHEILPDIYNYLQALSMSNYLQIMLNAGVELQKQVTPMFEGSAYRMHGHNVIQPGLHNYYSNAMRAYHRIFCK